MAGDWIKMRCNLDTDPAVFQIAAQLGLDELSVVGRLWKVWAWADQHVSDCHATGVTDVTLDRISTTPGFAAAMRRVGWITGESDSPTLPRFDRHNGQSAKTRALATERQSRKRHAAVTPESRPERDQRREEKSNTPIVPKGDIKPEEVEDPIEAIDPLLLRAKAIFRMRPTAPLDRSLARAWKTARAAVAGTTEPEWQLLEAYYCAVIASRDDYRRRDLATLLNNWSTELTRAAAWAERVGWHSENSEKKEKGPAETEWREALQVVCEQGPELLGDIDVRSVRSWSQLPADVQAAILKIITDAESEDT
jgi:hypothetical protein